MSRRHRHRARATNSRSNARVVRASFLRPDSPYRERRPNTRTNKYATTARARGARSRPIASPSRARHVHECARGTPRHTNHASSSSSIIHRRASIERPSSRRDANKQKTKKNRRRVATDRTTDIPRRRRRHPTPTRVVHARPQTDPRVRPTARPTDRSKNHVPLFFFFCPRVQITPIASISA